MEESVTINLERYDELLSKVEKLELIKQEVDLEGGIDKLLQYKNNLLAYQNKIEQHFKNTSLIIYTKLIDRNGNVVSTDIKSNFTLKEQEFYINQEIAYNKRQLELKTQSSKNTIEVQKELLKVKIKKDLETKVKNLEDYSNSLLKENELLHKQNSINVEAIKKLENSIKIDLTSRIKFLFNKNYYKQNGRNNKSKI